MKNNNNNYDNHLRVLENILLQKSNPNPLIKKVDSITFENLKELKDRITNKDILKVYEIERISTSTKTPYEKFINTEIPMTAFVDNFETNNLIHADEESIKLEDISYIMSDNQEYLPKGKSDEPVYKYNSKYKIYNGFENRKFIKPKYESNTFNSFVKKKIEKKELSKIKSNKFFDVLSNIAKKINKYKLNFYHYIFSVLNKFSKFLYLQTLSKEQRDSLKNMEFNPNSSDNSAIVKLILKKHFNLKELKDKVRKFEKINSDFEKINNNRDNHLLFE